MAGLCGSTVGPVLGVPTSNRSQMKGGQHVIPKGAIFGGLGQAYGG